MINIGPVKYKVKKHGAIAQFDLEGKYIKLFNKPSEAVKSLGKPLSATANVIKCAKGEIPTAYGYQWRWKGDYEHKK